jgi:hypothetical protein
MKRATALLALFFFPATAAAYLLSANAILSKMASHRDGLFSSLVVHGTFSFWGEEARAAAAALQRPETEALSAPATITYKSPGRCRVELDSSEPRAAAIDTDGAVRTLGPAVPALKLFASRVCPLLEPHADERDLLKSAGIDSGVVALGRINNTVAWVIGARPKQVSVPSLWVEKDRFEPLRLISRSGARLTDVRLIDYSSPASGDLHPRVVEFHEGKDLIARFVVESVEVNARVPD